jgi:hypothetical protein
MTRVTTIQREAFADHVLTLAYADADEGCLIGDLASFEGVKFVCIVMKRPRTRNMLVQVTFSPEGIALQGDVGLGPTQHGLCSTRGYGLGWFVGDLSEDYLAEKFLRPCWTAQRAIEEVRWRLGESKAAEVAAETEAEREALRARAAVWADALTKLEGGGGEYGEHGLYDDLADAEIDTSDGVPGWGCDIDDQGWLCGIQQAFRRLWLAAAVQS